VSGVDAAEARAVGRSAVFAAVEGPETSGSIAMVRASEGAYAVSNKVTPLRSVAKETKSMPVTWINEAGNDVVLDEFLPYVKPLVDELPAIGQLSLRPVSLAKSRLRG
jgi:6-phosphofructokinase 1